MRTKRKKRKGSPPIWVGYYGDHAPKFKSKKNEEKRTRLTSDGCTLLVDATGLSAQNSVDILQPINYHSITGIIGRIWNVKCVENGEM